MQPSTAAGIGSAQPEASVFIHNKRRGGWGGGWYFRKRDHHYQRKGLRRGMPSPTDIVLGRVVAESGGEELVVLLKRQPGRPMMDGVVARLEIVEKP